MAFSRLLIHIKRASRFCFFGLLFLLALTAQAQNTSNKGKDFWLGYGNHVSGFGPMSQRMVVYITSDVDTHGNVEIPGLGVNIPFTVTANAIRQVDIPQAAYLNGEGKYNTGIHITAEKAIVVYAHIYNASVSGATLVLPTTTLGKDYYSINYTQVSNQPNSYSYFFVVAVEDNTEVEITPSVNTLGTPGQPPWLAGTTRIIRLNKGEIYQVLGALTSLNDGNRVSGGDLTGSRVRSVSTSSESCKPIAVFSGSGKISIGCDNAPSPGSADNLFQQVYPTASWGKRFITAPLKSRNYDIYRIVKSDPQAVVTLNGSRLSPSFFVKDFYYEFSSRQANVIESDKPIQVIQYAVTQGKTMECGTAVDLGDPEMIFLNPVEQTLSKITMYSASSYAITDHYINVIIKTAGASGFTVDNANMSGHFNPIPGQSDYSYAQIPVSAGTHTLAADSGFNAIAYGYGDHESYGYAAGANLRGLSIEAVHKELKQTATKGCVNETYDFKIHLGYPVNKLVWNFGNNEAPFEQLNPSVDSTYLLDEKTYYVYKYPQEIVFTEARDYNIEVAASKLSADGCGATEMITSEFSIAKPPVAGFTVGPSCVAADIEFTDKSDGLGNSIIGWKWDFGDGNSSDEQNPKHKYVTAGTYTVKLWVSTEFTCLPVLVTKQINVVERPLARFVTTQAVCERKEVIFTDQSTASVGTVSQWIWDFGDGTSRTYTSLQPFQHVYSAAGSYQVKLRVVSSLGCASDIFIRQINVKPLPVVSFTTPEVCLADAFAQFVNTSSLSNSSNSGLTYLWDFGDAAPGAANPNTSTEKDPKHKYTRAGNYIVTLTVTSSDGCSETSSKSFQVNGSVPKADFILEDEKNLCSNNELIFRNTSTVDFGSITRLEWIFDDVNNFTEKIADEEPAPDKVYTHRYPVFYTPLTKNYRVKLRVFSGETCFDEITKDITIHAAPDLKLAAADSVCYASTPFQLTAATVNSLPGGFTFSGKGILESGTFNPAVAGVGTHELVYTFTGVNGCSVSEIHKIKVLPSPTVTVQRNVTLLEGGILNLDMQTAGENLSYKWTPSTGLNRDDIPNPTTTVASDIIYTVTVTSKNGCTVSDNVAVKVLSSPGIPNTFTPNGDGINDFWTINFLNTYPDCSINVFTRYGNKVFGTIGYSAPWDGKFNGEDLPAGTYYYVIDPKNGRKPISGSVTIVR